MATIGPAIGGVPSLFSVAFDLGSVGYAAHEHVATGTASAYAASGPRSSDGHWAATPSGTAAFTTRLIVYRPTDPARANGTVIVEWLNVTGGLDVPALWMPTHRHLVVEFSVPHAFTRRGTTCSWTGLWTPQTLFALHYRTVVNPDTGRCVESNDIEHYDLRHDPHELHNLASGNSQREARRKERLGKLLDKLRDCVGSEGSLAVQGPGTAACE